MKDLSTTLPTFEEERFMKLSTASLWIATSALFSFGCAPQAEPIAETAPPAPEPVRAVIDAAAQQALTPEQVLTDLKAGNQRFVEGTLTQRDYMAQAEATAAGGQFPKATILGCVDSRVPPELAWRKFGSLVPLDGIEMLWFLSKSETERSFRDFCTASLI